MKLINSCLLTLQMIITNFGNNWSNSSWEDVNGRQHIEIGHMSVRWPDNFYILDSELIQF